MLKPGAMGTQWQYGKYGAHGAPGWPIKLHSVQFTAWEWRFDYIKQLVGTLQLAGCLASTSHARAFLIGAMMGGNDRRHRTF